MKIILYILACCTAFSAFAQQSTAAFPQAWEGSWSGTLDIYTEAGRAQQVPMELHILPRDSFYTYTIIYGEDKEAGLRDYLLKTIDSAKGWYLVDEQNSISMDALLLGGKLYSRFEVMGSLLMSSLELMPDGRMQYEIISGNLTPLRSTGGEVFEGEDIPEVKAYPVKVRQIAYLQRM